MDYLDSEECAGCKDINECIQQLQDISVLVTFKEQDVAEAIAGLDQLDISGGMVSVSPVDNVKTFVKVHYLPCEIPNEAIVDVLKEFGIIYKIKYDKYATSPNVCTGTRTVTMSVKRAIPSFLQVEGYTAKTFYKDQVKICRFCGKAGHFARDCLGVRCYECGGHVNVAKQCDPDLSCDWCTDSHETTRCPVRIEEMNALFDELRKEREEDERQQDESGNEHEQEGIEISSGMGRK